MSQLSVVWVVLLPHHAITENLFAERSTIQEYLI